MFCLRRVTFGLAVWAFPCLACAAVTYHSESNRLHVTGFPEERPGTLDDMLDADRREGWGVVSYEPATDTFRLDASLWIGCDKDAGTYFQVGSLKHPRVTVLVRGDVWVRPPKKSLVRTEDRRYAIANRLQLGLPGVAEVRPVLKIACAGPQEHGLFVGVKGRAGGSLFLYHATVTAAVPDREHVLRGFAHSNKRTGYVGGCWAHELQLHDSTLSWFGETLVLSAPTMGRNDWAHHNFVVNGMTIEHCDGVRFYGAFVSRYRTGDEIPEPLSTFLVRRTRFHDIGAVSSYMSMTFIGCRFQDVARPMNFRSLPTNPHIVFIDCDLGEQAENFYLARAGESQEGRRRPDPKVDELATLMVHVRDQDGASVPAAMVSLTCDADASAVRRGLAVSGRDGKTPEETERGALLLTVRRWEAAEDPEAPRVKRFPYAVNVRASGYLPAHAEVSAEQAANLPRPLGVVLKRKSQGAQARPERR